MPIQVCSLTEEDDTEGDLMYDECEYCGHEKYKHSLDDGDACNEFIPPPDAEISHLELNIEPWYSEGEY